MIVPLYRDRFATTYLARLDAEYVLYVGRFEARVLS
jgi:hypothetical protein